MKSAIFAIEGIPATGLVYPVWAIAAMTVSATAIFFNSLWGGRECFSTRFSLSGVRPPDSEASGS